MLCTSKQRDRAHTTRLVICALFLTLLSTLPQFVATAQATTVAPHALFIDHRVRSTALFVYNPDDKPVEISVELVYGFPRGNGEGGVEVFLEDSPAKDAPSCAQWVKAMPRRLILPPGERQTIRLLARPPAGLADGEYWSRVIISSKSAAEPVELEEAKGVQVGLDLATRTIISLNYRKGPVTTGIEVAQLRGALERDAVRLDMSLLRRGDAAWLGQLDVVLLDLGGREVQRWDQALAVYENIDRVLLFPLDEKPNAANYTLSLRYSTERDDLPPEGILPSEEIVRSMSLTLADSVGD